MGQFDSRTEAAQSQIDAEERESGLISRIPSSFLDLASLFLEFISNKEIAFASKTAISYLKLLAGHRSEQNVQYLLETVAQDLKELMKEVQGQNEKVEEIERVIKGERFSELLTEAALQATRTSSRKRIERLAHVVVSGSMVFHDKPLDAVADFERHCVELTDADVRLLDFLAKQQPDRQRNFESEWAQEIRMNWLNMPHTSGGGYVGISAIDARSSFARLQSRGLISQLSWGNITAGAGSDPYAVLEDGRAFLKFLRESSREV